MQLSKYSNLNKNKKILSLCILFLIFFLQVQNIFPQKLKPYKFKSSIYFSTQSKNNIFVFWITPKKNWHFYAPSKGDHQQSTRITAYIDNIQLPVYYPPASYIPNPIDPRESIAVYKNATPFFIIIPSSLLSKKLYLHLKLLLCSATKCFPLEQNIEFTLKYPKKKIPSSLQSILSRSKPKMFFKAQPSLQVYKQLPKFSPQPIFPHLETKSLTQAILFGFLAGLILNLMPCILPVIGLKLRAFQSILTQQKQIKIFKTHNFFFILGILTYFSILALFLAWTKVSWGEIFQTPKFILGILFFIFILALSMFELCQLPMLNLSKPSPHLKTEAFLTGLFITLLATPCSGPLLGGVLAWTLNNSPLITFIVFISIGIGLSFPYIIITFYPNLIIFFPKTGKWNLLLEKIIGFLLLATCIYLLYLLPSLFLFKTLIVLLTISFLLWIYKNFLINNSNHIIKFLYKILFVIYLMTSILWISNINKNDNIWTTYKTNTFLNIIGKKHILVDFTANWCPTCKVLEKTVLTKKFIRKLHKQYDIITIKVDLTTNNIEGKQLLNALNSQSIPLVAFFPKQNPLRPIIFRDVFTQKLIEKTLSKYFK
ncbi:thiol:disulfide interchange protein DsbD [Desulfonauticus submarinus]|uniref:Thiol:disulfide interchange protein DsbD n=1 Tax=Desulfonauticus submarinus TaxID=206665 RepID=A0A1H0CI65_9BACT|nr:cytochrome c biogenesis protein CcdA [Desulfonauticus submarinus]SDN57559.1 thiol:disulfide interchange protein DsbD [Desulfonauticus submarinus]